MSHDQDRLICTFGPKGLEYVHPEFMDAITNRDKSESEKKSKEKSRKK